MDTIELNIEEFAEGRLPTADSQFTHSEQLGNIIGTFMGAAMVFALLLVLLYLIWGAIGWITAGGDSGKLQEARNRMIQAVIGIIVLSATVAVFMFVQYILGIDVVNFN